MPQIRPGGECNHRLSAFDYVRVLRQSAAYY